MKEKVNKLTNPMLTHYLTLLRVTQDTQITRNWTKEHNSQKIINYKGIFHIGHTFKFRGGGRKNPRKQESEFPVDMQFYEILLSGFRGASKHISAAYSIQWNWKIHEKMNVLISCKWFTEPCQLFQEPDYRWFNDLILHGCKAFLIG